MSYVTDETGANITAHPLQWPLQHPRAARPVGATFTTTLGAARDGLLRELKLLGATGVIISSNLPLKANGQPYARTAGISDFGVAVYFNYLGGQRVLASDKWNALEANMQALRKTVEALRGLGRWGCSDILQGTFSGLLALAPAAAGAPDAGESWQAVLGLATGASEAEMRAAARRLLADVGRNRALSVDEADRQQQRIILARGKALASL
jgi:hypothetical protein